jgi:hypothetical protein
LVLALVDSASEAMEDLEAVDGGPTEDLDTAVDSFEETAF